MQFLHDNVVALSEKVEELESELRKKKKLPKKPKIRPSNLDKQRDGKKTKRKGRTTGKRKKKENLEIHETKKIKVKGLSEGWKLVGHEKHIRQDIKIQAHNVEYKLEKWKSPTGQIVVAELPPHLQNTHFGATLKTHIIYQYFECGVTQPLIYKSLKDIGIDISSGQVSAILTENNEVYHTEKEEILKTGISISEELRTDDTGARHQFKNAFCNCINTSLFTYFETTYSKSRINFLEILRSTHQEYRINEESLDYIKDRTKQGKYYQILYRKYSEGQTVIADKKALAEFFKTEEIISSYAIRLITEALLIGTIVEHGFDLKTVIHSDGARQFNLFVHSLCWKHAERPLVKLISYNEYQEEQLELKKSAFWQMYQNLKEYKEKPSEQKAKKLSAQFDQLCEEVDNYASINLVLKDLVKKKDQLLLVLKQPNTSLHNNDSERDIREYVKRRKISAGTRSENGRKARDSLLSLKKTCRKLQVSFWEYLLDRSQNLNQIPPLSEIMRQKHQVSLG